MIQSTQDSRLKNIGFVNEVQEVSNKNRISYKARTEDIVQLSSTCSIWDIQGAFPLLVFHFLAALTQESQKCSSLFHTKRSGVSYLTFYTKCLGFLIFPLCIYQCCGARAEAQASFPGSSLAIELLVCRIVCVKSHMGPEPLLLCEITAGFVVPGKFCFRCCWTAAHLLDCILSQQICSSEMMPHFPLKKPCPDPYLNAAVY